MSRKKDIVERIKKDHRKIDKNNTKHTKKT